MWECSEIFYNPVWKLWLKKNEWGLWGSNKMEMDCLKLALPSDLNVWGYLKVKFFILIKVILIISSFVINSWLFNYHTF